MDEQFETRPLIGLDVLRALQQKNNYRSTLRLTLHLLAFAVLSGAVIGSSHVPLLSFSFAVALAWVWSGLFGPFHECVHRTAFRSRHGNTIGAWLAGIPFAMAPAVYRTFHFEHHRHTQNVAKDPELLNDARYAEWPTGFKNWLNMATGLGLIKLKLSPLIGFSIKPRSVWASFARWHGLIENPPSLVMECRIVLGLWFVFLAAALFVIPGGGWLVFAAWFTHVFQTLWVASEHTGLPLEGSILARTRSVTSNRFVRWWQWNMNYHAEHHAWPSIPWHRLPAARQHIAGDLPSLVPGYALLHRNVIAVRNTPSCDP